jgi:hypothetical protein
MSLAETQELMRTMQELIALLDSVETRTDKLIDNAPKVGRAGDTFHQAERLALRFLAITRKMGLPDQIEQATQVVSQLVVMFQMLLISSSMITGGGLGALIGIAGVVMVSMNASDMMGYDSSRGNY